MDLFPRPVEPTHFPRELTDAQVLEQKAGVRGQIVHRLEELWDHCKDHLDHTGDRPDPRYAQLGLAVLRELGTVWELKVRSTPKEEEPEPVEQRQRLLDLVKGQIKELEERSENT